MRSPVSFLRIFATLASLTSCACAQPVATRLLENPDFEAGEIGKPPEGWILGRGLKQPGKSARLTNANPAQGRTCVLIENSDASGGGALLQPLDATPLRGKRIRFRAAVRSELADDAAARLTMFVTQGPAGAVESYDGKPGTPLFSDDMFDRPIKSRDWSYYEIVGDVDQDATWVTVSCLLSGAGKVWLDDAKLEVLGAAEPVIAAESPRAFSQRGLANVIAFARLLGYVRYFHPSDEAAAADWDAFAIAGIRQVETAANTTELQRILTRLFASIAPSVQTHRTNSAPETLNLPGGNNRLITRDRRGIGPYPVKRAIIPFPNDLTIRARLLTPFLANLGDGVVFDVPLALFLDDEGTLPHPRSAGVIEPVLPKLTKSRTTPNDRATRLAIITLAWNLLQHGSPRLDEIDVDWPAELKKGLEHAANDADGISFLSTLRRMMAALRDGHASANFSGDTRAFMPDFRAEWIEDQLIVTVASNAARQAGLAPGDVILALDGRPIPEKIAEAESMISGATPQWIRFGASRAAFLGTQNSRVTVEFEPFATPGKRKTAVLSRETVLGPLSGRIGETVRELEPEIFYIDLDRLTPAQLEAALPALEKARGLIFDLRGYPNNFRSFAFFQHLTKTPLASPQWHLPRITQPDHIGMNFERDNHDDGEWSIAPKPPYLTAKRAFITDARAMSSAENCMSIVEHYKLGAIIGGPTAGTTGEVSSMTLPAGYSIRWTNLKPLKQDGSQIQGVGILPTIPCAPTRAGIAAGHDELLERALAAVKSD